MIIIVNTNEIPCFVFFSVMRGSLMWSVWPLPPSTAPLWTLSGVWNTWTSPFRLLLKCVDHVTLGDWMKAYWLVSVLSAKYDFRIISLFIPFLPYTMWCIMYSLIFKVAGCMVNKIHMTPSLNFYLWFVKQQTII